MELKKTKKEKSRIEVIYNGLDYDHWNPDKYDGEKIRKQLNIAKKEFLLLCYGRPGPSKGIEYAISAMPKIVKKIPNARLLLILSKDKEYQKKYQELVELADNLKVSRSIIFHDSISYKDLPNYIKASDCVIVPSLSEGFGYAAAESCAMNIPVIATNNASLPEVVSGIYQLVPPKDSESIADAAVSIYRNEMMKKPIKRFEWADALKEYVKIYRKFK
jgi:glycosyltransferase involved in cell wall biosynthesis